MLLLHQQHFTVPQPPITTDAVLSVVQHRQALLWQSRTASLALRPSGASILCLGPSVKADGAHTLKLAQTMHTGSAASFFLGYTKTNAAYVTKSKWNGPLMTLSDVSTNLTLHVVFQGWSGDPCPGLSGRCC